MDCLLAVFLAVLPFADSFTSLFLCLSRDILEKTSWRGRLWSAHAIQAGLDKLRAIIQGNLGFIFATRGALGGQLWFCFAPYGRRAMNETIEKLNLGTLDLHLPGQMPEWRMMLPRKQEMFAACEIYYWTECAL